MSTPNAPRASLGLLKGLLVGALLELPALALCVWVLSHSLTSAPLALNESLRLVVLFAGVATIMTTASLGYRAIAQALPRRQAMGFAARNMALAAIGLTLIACIAASVIPLSVGAWVALLGIAAGHGAIVGTVLGAVVASRSPVQAADLLALAKRPTYALFQASRRPIVHLGTRASHLVDGLFDPATQRPDTPLTFSQSSDDATPDEPKPQ